MRAAVVFVAVLALAAVVLASEAASEADMEKPKRAKVVGGKRVVYPRVDHSLLRSSPNVVLVPRGDPRARPPQSPASAAPAARAALTASKAPHSSGKKPHVTPANPAAGGAGSSSINVGAAAPAPVLKAAAPQYSSAACTAKRGSCTSSCASGTVVHGICPGPSSIACCVPKGSAPSTPTAPSSGSNCLSNFNPSTFAARALQYQQTYRSHGVIYSQSSRQFGATPKYADCSSFVTSVLDSLGWDCLFASGRYTAAMIPIMRARGGFHSSPSRGDIVMWSGHTGIVVETCSGGRVRMVAMGTHGCADTGCITVASLHGWGAGTFLGFWTPK